MEQVKENLIKEKSFLFAVRIVKLRRYLNQRHKEYTLSEQILRSGTSIGANVSEAEYAQSRADFVNKMSVALKEANETQYWLKLLSKEEYLDETQFQSLHNDCKELLSMLHAIVKTTKDKKGQGSVKQKAP